mgnify:CR=1 FL=1
MDDNIASIDEQIIGIGKSRLEDLGMKDSGLYNYYTARIENGSIFNNDDEKIIEYLQGQGLADSKILEVAAGCGQVSFALERIGFQGVEFCEFDKRRADFGIHIADKIGSNVVVHSCDYRELELSNYDVVFVVNAVSSALGKDDSEQIIGK